MRFHMSHEMFAAEDALQAHHLTPQKLLLSFLMEVECHRRLV
jgi:hypothetical protein